MMPFSVSSLLFYFRFMYSCGEVLKMLKKAFFVLFRGNHINDLDNDWHNHSLIHFSENWPIGIWKATKMLDDPETIYSNSSHLKFSPQNQKADYDRDRIELIKLGGYSSRRISQKQLFFISKEHKTTRKIWECILFFCFIA